MVRGQIYQAIFETQDENYKKLSKDPLSVAWDSYQKVIQLDDKNKFEKDLKTQYANLVIDFTIKVLFVIIKEWKRMIQKILKML